MIRDLHTVIAYLKWLPKTFHLHGIHSPFIFKLEKEVLRGKTDPVISQKLYTYRDSLLNTKNVIEVHDYGEGSRVFKSARRKVSAIARVSGSTHKRITLLQRLIAYIRPEETLELGTSLGLATAALAIKNTGKVTSIEGCPNTAAIAKKEIEKSGITNIELCIGDFKSEIEKLLPRSFEFIYFDGNHSKTAVLDYVDRLMPTVTEDTIWVFDDIYWSAGMTQAWEQIKRHKNVTVTVDCFWFGMIFFRPQQAKENFYIRL